MIKENDTRCTGCKVCELVCPKNCIEMNKNEEGFIYPNIKKEKCINCNLCSKFCTIDNHYKNPLFSQEAYLATNKNRQEVLKSSSAGVFGALSEIILLKKGVVIGVKMDENMNVFHQSINEIDKLDELRGSKYVQSDVRMTYKETKENLEKGKYVLYSGTPCQIAGLRNFLKKDYDKLITVDLLCHGVPSPTLFNSHMKFLSQKHKSKVKEYKFRNKGISKWGDYKFYYRLENNKEYYGPALLDLYFKLFINGESFRECCYTCEYACKNRVGDFTIGDFWGGEKYHPENMDENGTSVILFNTEKSRLLESEIKKRLQLTITNIDYISERNNSLKKVVDKPKSRKYIYKEINRIGYKCWAKKFYRSKFYISKKILSMIPNKIKVAIRNRYFRKN